MLSAWALDCVDGDLSRMLGHDSSTGVFEDIMGDNLACLVFPLALIQTGLLNGVIGGLFIFGSFTNIWMINRDKDGGGLIFRPRSSMVISLPAIFIWALMFGYLFFRFNIFNGSFLAVAILLSLSVAGNYFSDNKGQTLIYFRKKEIPSVSGGYFFIDLIVFCNAEFYFAFTELGSVPSKWTLPPTMAKFFTVKPGTSFSWLLK